ncbi:unnamed protein product [Trifolium pratense]|uniref:Uncharacterized protein n=1 Tax=Trifolium pratense TaxID=57577 RepID=A0ACB0LMK2_TRIPR|nr:unnamed protein product [Trifolium pratense]
MAQIYMLVYGFIVFLSLFLVITNGNSGQATPCLTDLDCPNLFYCKEKFCAPIVWKHSPHDKFRTIKGHKNGDRM